MLYDQRDFKDINFIFPHTYRINSKKKSFSYKRNMTNHIVLSEIENRLHKLERRVKKDEISGLLDGKERT